MIILYDNAVLNATITASSENPYFLFSTALIDPRTTRVGQTIGLNEWLKFSFTGAIDVDYGYVFANNMTSSATVTIQANATDVWTSPSIDQAMTYNSLNQSWIYAFPTTQSYQYWRITVVDATNPDGYIQIANIFIGEKLVMPGINPDARVPYTSNASISKTISGQMYGDRRVRLKSGTVTAPIIKDAKRKEIDTFFDYVDLTVPYITLFWEDDLDVEPPLYNALTKSLEWAKNPGSGLTWTLGLEFEETR